MVGTDPIGGLEGGVRTRLSCPAEARHPKSRFPGAYPGSPADDDKRERASTTSEKTGGCAPAFFNGAHLARPDTAAAAD